MSNESIVPLDPNSPEAKFAVTALLGATLAELKQIDSQIVGGSKNIRGNQIDLGRVFNTPPPTVAAPPPPPSPLYTTVNAGINVTPNHSVAIAPAVVEQPTENPDQLLFDFTTKITPITINDKLDRILDRLDRVLSKLQ